MFIKLIDISSTIHKKGKKIKTFFKVNSKVCFIKINDNKSFDKLLSHLIIEKSY